MASNATSKEVTVGYNYKIPQEIMTPNAVKTRLATLHFYDGIPTKDTLKKVYDNLDFMRGVEVFLNFIPATSIEGIRRGMASMGVSNYNEVMVFDNLMNSAPLFLTGNTDTVYASSMIDLKKNGPTVIEMPAGAGPGTINDAFFRFVVDMGAPGPDAMKGGTYLILPPDYKGALKPTKNGMEYRGKDTRVTKILQDAVAVGNATARAISLRPRDPKAYLFQGKQWYTGFVGKKKGGGT